MHSLNASSVKKCIRAWLTKVEERAETRGVILEGARKVGARLVEFAVGERARAKVDERVRVVRVRLPRLLSPILGAGQVTLLQG